MVTDPASTEQMDLLAALFEQLLSFAVTTPLGWVIVVVLIAVAGRDPAVRQRVITPLVAALRAVLESRLRAPSAPASFFAGAPLAALRVSPWTIVAALAAVVVVGALLASSFSARSALERAEMAETLAEAAEVRAVQSERRADLAEHAAQASDSTHRAEAVAAETAREAVSVIRYAPRATPRPALPSPPRADAPTDQGGASFLQPTVDRDAPVDPVPVFADAVGRLLNDTGGLLPAAA